MADRNYDLSKGGVKFDQGKPDWSLLPLKACLEGVIFVLMKGAKKYTRHNWRTGMPWSRVLDAAKRHIFAWEEGEDLDQESGLNHIDHALCELLFLRYYITKGLGEDDRYAPEGKKLTGMSLEWEDYTFPTGSYLSGPSRIMTNPTNPLQLYNDGEFVHEDAEGDPNYWGV